VSAWDLRILWALLSNIVPSVSVLSVCKVALSKCNSRGWLHGCQLRRPFSESSALGVLRLPHVPCMQITPWDVTLIWVVFVPVALQRWYVLSHPYTSCTDPWWVGSLPTGNSGCGLKATFLYLSSLTGVPRPEASTPLLCRLLHGYPYLWVSGEGTLPWPAKLPRRLYYADPGRRLRPVNTRGRGP